MDQKFWKEKPLEQMSLDEWESLCDGCGLCCLEKLEDEETGEIISTMVACRHLDIDTCSCNVYENRHEAMPSCLTISPENLKQITWLPETCAYRRLAEGNTLLKWHYLESGNRASVHTEGVSVRDFAISGEHVHPDDIINFAL